MDVANGEVLSRRARRVQGSRRRVGVGAAVVLLLLALGATVLISILQPHSSSRAVVTSPRPSTSAMASGAEIYVHVLGAVVTPGLYTLRDGARAVDAIAAAGGYASDADQTAINLARFVVDGEQILVPRVGEASGEDASSGVGADGKVNINKASAAELETLPRVGPAMAQRIIDWREENGPFTSVDDLRNVTGIGDKTFEELKDLVTV